MRYLIYLMLLTSMSLNAGTIHKWVDEEGNTHYGDAPPVTAKTEGVRVQSAPSNPGKALPRLSSPDSSQATAGGSGDAAQNENVPEDQARVACEKAQEDLKIINNSNRIKLRSVDGSTRYMTSEEIEERKTQSEADIERFCE
ncbi:MAG: DUF4124 domain-containing protein [Gammaproteobacteria bacterium]|nr:DUF4124 domain-containing protein [Gammaproteobacteria bacterium]MDH3859675.1 DUF4124 domain-containing protein [Gammaproteobacteria bacterium]